MMIDIAICDDDIILTSALEKNLTLLSETKNLDVNIDIFYDGENLLQHIKTGHIYDIIYLDIEMKHKNGIVAAQELRQLGSKSLLIYVTSHESFAKGAFEVDAFRFLTKPIDSQKFESYFLAAIKKLFVKPIYFQYKFNREVYKIELDKILYFQSNKRITYIISEFGTMQCYEKLNVIENFLKEKNILFYRIHQSFLVNPKYVKKYRYDMIELFDGTEFTISEKRRKSVNEVFCQVKGEELIEF